MIARRRGGRRRVRCPSDRFRNLCAVRRIEVPEDASIHFTSGKVYGIHHSGVASETCRSLL